MLYNEFLEGTGAVDTQETYDEYKRVEAIYMQADLMTKEDAYRMARIVTVKEHEKAMKKARKAEEAWVLDNIIPAAAFIRGMSEKEDYFRGSFTYRSPCGNIFEMKLERDINGGSVRLYSFWINGKEVDLKNYCSYGLLPSAEFGSYRANWHDKTREELEELFGYIA